MTKAKTTTVKCPSCGTRMRWSSDNAYRPFCSERCKLIDLGAWASDRYAIAGVPLEPMDAPAGESSESSGRN